jgi:predicted RecA/RadA family phage recombinase
MACLCNGGLFPRLFFTQSATPQTLTAATNPNVVLTLEPIATLSGDEVKLDSMVELAITSANAGVTTNVSGGSYVLQRSTNGGAFVDLAQLDIDTQITGADTVTLYPNLTWVDVPGVGTHVYRVVINVAAIAGITYSAETRALNALVVREA